MRTMRDLEGKSVAVESGALGAFVLSRALALNGMQASDVNVVHLESNEQPRRVREGPGRRRRDVRSVPRAVPEGRRHDAVRQHADPRRDRRPARRARTSVLDKRAEGDPGAADRLVRRARLHASATRTTRRAAWASASRPAASSSSQAQRGLHVPSREENLRMLGGAAARARGHRAPADGADARGEAAAQRPRDRARARARAAGGPADEALIRFPASLKLTVPLILLRLRGDAQHGEPALPRAAGRARRRGRQPQAPRRRSCRGCRARSSTCC